MTLRIILRPHVPGDMHEIVARLERSSNAIADRFVVRFRRVGRSRRNAGDGESQTIALAAPRLAGLRSWAVPGFPRHLIYYTTTDEAIIVYAGIHGARNVRAVLKDRQP